MSLRVKFNLCLIPILLGILGATAYFGDQLLKENARQEVIQKANILMESANAVRSYTVKEVKPLLAVQQRRQFLPQSVPTYSANQTLNQLKNRFPKYAYKDAVLNPTNPANRATSWESDIINWFKNNVTQDEVVGEKQTAIGPFLYLAKPITIKNKACLACHSTPKEAPQTLIDTYGSQNGFGWKLNEIIGAQVVTVPMSIPLQRADKVLMSLLMIMGGSFLFLVIAINIVLSLVFLKPINRLSVSADSISLGDQTIEEFVPNGKDELASLTRAFNRMRRSLNGALTLLDKRLDNAQSSSGSSSNPSLSNKPSSRGPQS